MEKNDNLKVVYKNIDEITPYKNNPRKNDNAVEYVKNSIKDFGFEDSNLFEDEENEKDNLDTEYQQLYDKTVIAIEFDTEEKLEAAFTKLTDEGYKCQILTL